MSKFLTKFETTAAYEAAKTILFKPNVSLVKDNAEVYYAPIIKVSGVSLNKSELSLAPNATETLVATVLPSNASNKTVTWSSSNQSVATVSSNGVVTAVGNIGDSTTITVTTVDGGFSAECTVKIPQMIDGHEYVEIGGIKWATMNVGASSETDFGNYYQYGKGAKDASETGWGPIYNGTSPLPKSADTASQVWGGSWRTPTKAEFESLVANTNYSYTTFDGKTGALFTAKNDSSKTLFFILAGLYDRNTGRPSGNAFYAMSSERSNSDVWELQGTNTSCMMNLNSIQQYGYSVRPVAD